MNKNQQDFETRLQNQSSRANDNSKKKKDL